MKTTKQEMQAKKLEEEKQYNTETIDISASNYYETTGDFEYFKYGFWGRLFGTIVKGIVKLINPLLVKIIYHLKIEGKKSFMASKMM